VHGLFRLQRSGQIALILMALAMLALILAYAAPVRAMGIDGTARLSPEAARPNSAPTGAAALFGIDEGDRLSWDPNALALATATGVSWTRIAVGWRYIEPNKDDYRFNSSDALNTLHAGGLDPIVYLSEIPAWMGNNLCGPIDTSDPSKLAELTDIMRMLASRYPFVKIWALENEEDKVDCFGTGNDYVKYAQMLAAAWKGVHDGNPNAKLGVGALGYDNFKAGNKTCPPKYPGCNPTGGFNYSFVSNLFKYIANPNNALPTGQKYMDMVLFNYYDVYGRYWETVANGHGVQAKANAIRKQMTAAGIKPPVPLLVTETGEDSGGWWIGAKGQARCLDITMVRGAAARLQGIVWWTFKDNPGNPSPSVWKYGIVDENLNKKLSYTALQTLATELNGFNLTNTLSNKTGLAGIEAYKFTSGAVTKFVVWSSTYKNSDPAKNGYHAPCSWARTSRIATFTATKLRIVNYDGTVTTIKDGGKLDKNTTKGKIGIALAGDPKIVQLNPPQ